VWALLSVVAAAVAIGGGCAVEVAQRASRRWTSRFRTSMWAAAEPCETPLRQCQREPRTRQLVRSMPSTHGLRHMDRRSAMRTPPALQAQARRKGCGTSGALAHAELRGGSRRGSARWRWRTSRCYPTLDSRGATAGSAAEHLSHQLHSSDSSQRLMTRPLRVTETACRAPRCGTRSR